MNHPKVQPHQELAQLQKMVFKASRLGSCKSLQRRISLSEVRRGQEAIVMLFSMTVSVDSVWGWGKGKGHA